MSFLVANSTMFKPIKFSALVMPNNRPFITHHESPPGASAIDYDMRWLIVLISDTGMRLAEGAGLLKEDLVGLDTGQPYVGITKHPWHNLKT